jgi:hypothetical protein
VRGPSVTASGPAATSRAVTRFLGVYMLMGVAGLTVVAGSCFEALRGVQVGFPDGGPLAGLCCFFSTSMLNPGSVVVVAMGAFGLAAVGRGAHSAWRQVLARWNSIGALGPLTPVRIGRHEALTFEHASPQAFCGGFIRPRFYLSTGAIRVLTQEELLAVAAHESHHVRARDPLRLFLVRSVRDALFFLPVLRRLADRYQCLSEVAADAGAVAGNPPRARALAAALLRFEESGEPVGVHVAPQRVDHLLGGRPRWEGPGLPLVAGSLAIVVAGLAAVALADARSPVALDVLQLPALVCTLALTVAICCGALAIKRRVRRRGS